MPYSYGEPVSTTAAEVSRNFGNWQDRALVGPVIVTHHGRARVVIVSAEQFAAWRDLGPASAADNLEHVHESRLATILDHSSEGFCAFDHELRFTAVNPVACSYFAVARERLLGFSLTDRYPSLEGTLLVNRIRRVERTGESARFETNSLLFPERRVDFSIFPYPQGVGILFRNTTDQHNSDAALHENESLMQAISQSAGVAYFKLNVRGAPVDVGQAACRLVGLRREEILATRLVDLFPASARISVHRALEDALQHSRASVLTCAIHSGGGEDADVELSITPMVKDIGVDGAVVLATRVNAPVAQIP